MYALVHEDADGITSGYLLWRLFKDRFGINLDIVSPDNFGGPTFKVHGKEVDWDDIAAVADLGNEFFDEVAELNQDERRVPVLAFDHHQPKFKDKTEHCYLDTDHTGSSLVYEFYKDSGGDPGRWMKFVTAMGILGDVGHKGDSGSGKVYKNLRRSSPWMRGYVDRSYGNPDMLYPIVRRFNQLRRVIGSEAGKLGFKAVREIIEAENPFLVLKTESNLDFRVKYPAIAGVVEAFEAFEDLKKHRHSERIKGIITRIKYDLMEFDVGQEVEIAIGQHPWKVEKYMVNVLGGFIQVGFNTHSREVSFRGGKSGDTRKINLDELVSRMRTVDGGGHKMAAAGGFGDNSIVDCLNDLITNIIKLMTENSD